MLKEVYCYLRADSHSEFKIKSYYNCDKISLEDIQDFSQTVPEFVSADLNPLIIDDALSDKRTREFKSIVVHFIRSILCLPIYHDEEAIGILYLDHHSIPTLFTRKDLELAQTMGEAICSILKSSLDLKTVTIARDQLLGHSANKEPIDTFITNNKVMKSLLDRLPDIARTNAPILIYGESGTGKEILSTIIHSLSLRKNNPMVSLNCAAIPETMIEAELFGVEKNVATGVARREGKVFLPPTAELYFWMKSAI